MSRHTDRLRAEVRSLAHTGDSPEFRTTFNAFVASSNRDLYPWWERAGAWYMKLPHNRCVITPCLNWLVRHRAITVPLAVVVLLVEFALLPR